MWFEYLTSSMLNRILPRPRRPQVPGLVLGTRIDASHDDVVFPHRFRAQHLAVIGKTGFGKTHALEVIATQLAALGEGFAFFDFHGDASLSLMRRLLQISPDS